MSGSDTDRRSRKKRVMSRRDQIPDQILRFCLSKDVRSPLPQNLFLCWGFNFLSHHFWRKMVFVDLEDKTHKSFEEIWIRWWMVWRCPDKLKIWWTRYGVSWILSAAFLFRLVDILGIMNLFYTEWQTLGVCSCEKILMFYRQRHAGGCACLVNVRPNYEKSGLVSFIFAGRYWWFLNSVLGAQFLSSHWRSTFFFQASWNSERRFVGNYAEEGQTSSAANSNSSSSEMEVWNWPLDEHCSECSFRMVWRLMGLWIKRWRGWLLCMNM